MPKLRPVFKCHGGKNYLAQWIISQFPKKFNTYVEGCGGAASVLLNKPRSPTEVYNDADPAIANIFFQLANHPTEFLSYINKIEYTVETFENSKIYEHKGDLESAVRELVTRRMSRGGLKKAFSWSTRLRGGRPGDLNAWETYKDHLELIVKRLDGVKIECMNVIDLIDQYDGPDTLFYIDPPYLPSTRQSHNIYAFEMSEKDHLTLIEKVNAVKGKVIISGYSSPLYDKNLKNWKLACRPVANHSSQSKHKEKRIECLWMNYKCK